MLKIKSLKIDEIHSVQNIKRAKSEFVEISDDSNLNYNRCWDIISCIKNINSIREEDPFLMQSKFHEKLSRLGINYLRR